MFTIDTSWLEHSGGTKFYQMFQVMRSLPTGVMCRLGVAHYGPKSAIKHGDKRPISGGQVMVYDGEAAVTKLNEKLGKGGYHRPAPVSRLQFPAEGEFRAWLGQNIPTKIREDILGRLCLSLDPNADPIDPLDAPSAAAETLYDPNNRPAGWGSW